MPECGVSKQIKALRLSHVAVCLWGLTITLEELSHDC